MQEKILYWAKIIGVDPPNSYRVRRNQVTNLYMRHYRYNGYSPDDDTVYYEGKLTDTVIVHELIHKRYPDRKEKEVRELTAIIIRASKSLPPI